MTRALTVTLILSISLLPGLAGADTLTAMIQQDLTTLGYATGGTDGEMTVETAVAISQFQAQNGMDVTGEVTPQLAGVIKSKIGQQGQAAPAAAARRTRAAATASQQSVQAQQAQAQQAQAAQMAAAMQAAQMQGAAGMDPAAMQAMMQAGMDPAAMQAMMAQMQSGAAVDPAALQAMQAAQMAPAQTDTAQQACLQQMVAKAQVEQEQSQQSGRGFGGLMRAVRRLGGDELLAAVADAQADIAEANATIADLEAAAADLGLSQNDVAACQGQ